MCDNGDMPHNPNNLQALARRYDRLRPEQVCSFDSFMLGALANNVPPHVWAECLATASACITAIERHRNDNPTIPGVPAR